jgi:hypothetical protein
LKVTIWLFTGRNHEAKLKPQCSVLFVKQRALIPSDPATVIQIGLRSRPLYRQRLALLIATDLKLQLLQISGSYRKRLIQPHRVFAADERTGLPANGSCRISHATVGTTAQQKRDAKDS